MIYLVFAYGRFYPLGGEKDLKSTHSNLAEAKAAAVREMEKLKRNLHHEAYARVLRIDGTKRRVVFRLDYNKYR